MGLNTKSLGRRIRICRKKKGLTQNALSEIIDKSPTFVSYIECGSKSMSLETLVDIANALNVSADELLRDSLENSIIATNHFFADITADCSEYEYRILESVILATKKTLREN